MRLAALHKTTLIDFPGHVSAMVFTQGCNFTCPYCHNPQTQVTSQDETLHTKDVLEFLASRRACTQGLVISGGEPCLHKELPDFCRQVKALGFAIKLDTNGSRPAMLQQLLEEQLVDYVAMDIKASPWDYPKDIAPSPLGLNLLQSLALLEESQINHEYRITCVSPFISKDNILSILENLKKHVPVFLQQAKTETVLCPDFFVQQGHALGQEDINHIHQMARKAKYNCLLRN